MLFFRLPSFVTASFLYKDIIDSHVNYVQSRHQRMEPTADQFMLCVSDGKRSSAHVPFYIIINPTNDEIPDFVARNITVSSLPTLKTKMTSDFCSILTDVLLCDEVREGETKQLDSSVLHAMDLDVPGNVLHFSVVKAPQHGSIIEHSSDRLLSRRREASRQSTVVDFTMADLINGTSLIGQVQIIHLSALISGLSSEYVVSALMLYIHVL